MDQGELLIEPYVDLKTEYYDLGLVNRDETDDQVTVDAANATAQIRRSRQVRHHHAQRAARGGILPQEDVEKSPNGTIRAILDGTVFRAPILVRRH